MWRKWVLARRPSGVPTPEDFRLETGPVPEPQDGEVLIRVDYISLDPGMRTRLSRDSYAPALPLGSVIESAGLGTVVKSRNPKFAEGALVSGGFGWQSHFLSNGRGVARLDPTLFDDAVPLTTAIGVLGVPGLTAYFGLTRVAGAQAGQTVLISSAAGTVGATAGQIAKIMGLRAIGIASEGKIQMVLDLGFDACIDRRDGRGLAHAIREAAPGGVDIYFDNVGAEMLDAAIVNMKPRGRIVVSGQIAEYNATEPVGIRNTLEFISKRLRMEGFVVFDDAPQFAAAQATMAGWIRDGRLKFHEIVRAGLHTAPETFGGIMEGYFWGRNLVKV